MTEQQDTLKRRGPAEDQRLRHLLEQLPGVLWAVDRDLVITSSQGGGLVQIGLEPDQLVGMRLEDYLGTSDPEFPALKAARQALGGAHASYELRFKDRDFLTAVHPLYGENRQVVGAIGISFDVTSLKAVESELLQTSSLLRSTLESTGDGILVVDRDGTIRMHNQRFLEIWNIPEALLAQGRDAVVPHLAAQLKHPEVLRVAIQRMWDREPEKTRGELLEFLDGRVFERHVMHRRIGGEVVGTVTSLRDVTARSRAEAEEQRLLEQERRNAEASAFLARASKLLGALDYESSLLEVAAIALPQLGDWIIIDETLPEGGAYRRAVVHHDPSQGALVAGLEGIRDLIEPAGVPRAIALAETVLGSADPDPGLLGLADPERRALVARLGMRSFLSVPLRSRDTCLGALTLVSATNPARYGPREVTLLEDLAQRASLAIDNGRLYRQTLEAVRVRDEFLAVASHELNTPITGLLLSAEALERRFAQSVLDPALGRRLVETIRRQTEHLIDLARRLLEDSRLQREPHLNRTELDLAELVESVVDRLRPQTTRANCAVALDLHKPMRGWWDRPYLDQVVTNLLSNALKFGAGKPIEITLERAATPGFACLAVRDHGIGIAPRLHEAIFERFARAVSVRQYGGLGLGLYISRRIVELHGGRVRVESQPDQGASFIVELPLTEPTPPTTRIVS